MASKADHSMNKDESTPKWLKTIQLNSWEAELLISALVLYALFQVPDYLLKFSHQTFERGSFLHGFFGIIKTAVNLLKVGYILHIIVRGIWVASVGLSYVFPKGIIVDQLNFKGKFKKELASSGSLVKSVLRLEELSSIIYGISFLGFGSLTGTGFLIFFFVYLSQAFGSELIKNNFYIGGVLGILFLFLVFAALLVFIDFLTSGFFRKRKWTVDWFYPIAYVFRILTLSFLYRRSILVLQSNIKDWKRYTIPFAILICVVGFVSLNKQQKSQKQEMYFKNTQNSTYQKTNYESKRNEDDILIATIQSDIISSSVIQLYLDDLKLFDNIYRRDIGEKESWYSLSQDKTSRYMNKWIKVTIDSVDVSDVRYRITQHPTTYFDGFLAFLDLSNVERGNHKLLIQLDTTMMERRAQTWLKDSEFNYPLIASIEFFYDKQ